MNKNGQKLGSKNHVNVHSCLKQRKHKVKLNDNIGKSHNRTPSIRCHEEIASTIIATHQKKPEHFTCELDELCNENSKCLKKSYSKENVQIDSNLPNKKPMVNPYYNSTDKKTDTSKDLLQHRVKSKSSPILSKPNLEDSVDIIPVKLSTKINRPSYNKSPRKYEPKSTKSEKAHKHRGPTWDQLLKGETKNTSQNNVKSHTRPSVSDKNYNRSPNCYAAKKEEHYSRPNSKTDNLKDHNDNPSYKIHPPQLHELVNNKLQITDPIKTLDNLIERLREKIMTQPHNDNLNKIIADMENALIKIFPQEQPNVTELEISSSVKPSTITTSTTPKSDTKPSTISEWDIPSLKKNLEESCLFLQSLCIKQRENCTNHLREKEQLSVQLAESRRLVAIAKSRETDYEKTIGELRLKLQVANTLKDQQAQSIQELNKSVTKLKAENEALGSLNTCLRESSAEKEKLLSFKELEIEKLKFLLKLKTSVAPPINKMKFEEAMIEDELKLNIPQDDKDNSLSFPTESSLNLCKPKIICSSQASSSPRRSPSPYESWQHISSIPQDLTEINQLRNSMVRVFKMMKTDTECSDSLGFELEEPVVPSLYSEDDEVNPKEIDLNCGSFETLSS